MASFSRRTLLKSGALGLAGYGLSTGLVGCAADSFLGFGGSANSLKLIHITDSHLDLAKADTSVWLKSFVAKVNSTYGDTDMVLFGGDNFNNNAPGAGDAEAFKAIADGLNCPWYAVRGNKEASPKPKGDPLNQADFAAMFFGKELSVHGPNWKISQGDYTVLGLDSSIDGHNNGLYTAETLDFVESELQANPDTHYVLVNHHAYVNYWQSKDSADIHKYVLNNDDEVKKRLFKYANLKLTLSGHKHRNDISKIGTTKVVSTVGFKVPQGEEKDHQFRLIAMTDGIVATEVVGIN